MFPFMVARGWSAAQHRAYVIADNKLALNAGWDEDLLKIDLGDLKDLDFNLELTGFSLDEIGDILRVICTLGGYSILMEFIGETGGESAL